LLAHNPNKAPVRHELCRRFSASALTQEHHENNEDINFVNKHLSAPLTYLASVKTLILSTVYLLLGTVGLSAFGNDFSFSDWNSIGPNNAEGTIDGIGIHFSGEVSHSSQVGNTGPIQYWTEYGHDLPYTPVTGMLPTTTDIIALSTVGAFTITFDHPVLNPVMLVSSLGQPNIHVTYSFDQTATVLSSGYSYWNNYWPSPVFELDQTGSQSVLGVDGNGVIGFNGLVSEISWTTDRAEDWHGFTLALDTAQAVPDSASTFASLCMSLMVLGVILRWCKPILA
jgi:hypothetical protein